MIIRNVKPNFILTLMVMALVSACVSTPNYAPVISYFPELNEVQEGQYHVVQMGETLRLISSNTRIDFQSLAHWNNLSPPYLVNFGQKIRLFDPNLSGQSKKYLIEDGSTANKSASPKNISPPSEKLQPLNDKPVKKASIAEVFNEKKPTFEEKKSTISNDKEKVLKLNFDWPLKGKILKQFLQSKSKGIDIAGKSGQSVAAAEAGKVVYSGQGLLGYGNLLIIKHTDIFLSAYANNSRLLVSEGEVVSKGQAIAEVGQIGSKQASLHFEIRKNGKPVNPLVFLSKK